MPDTKYYPRYRTPPPLPECRECPRDGEWTRAGISYTHTSCNMTQSFTLAGASSRAAAMESLSALSTAETSIARKPRSHAKFLLIIVGVSAVSCFFDTVHEGGEVTMNRTRASPEQVTAIPLLAMAPVGSVEIIVAVCVLYVVYLKLQASRHWQDLANHEISFTSSILALSLTGSWSIMISIAPLGGLLLPRFLWSVAGLTLRTFFGIYYGTGLLNYIMEISWKADRPALFTARFAGRVASMTSNELRAALAGRIAVGSFVAWRFHHVCSTAEVFLWVFAAPPTLVVFQGLVELFMLRGLGVVIVPRMLDAWINS